MGHIGMAMVAMWEPVSQHSGPQIEIDTVKNTETYQDPPRGVYL